jgi:hypothetical protein
MPSSAPKGRMKVTVSLSQQQQQVLTHLAESLDPVPTLEQLIARAFGEYCDDHPLECGEEPGAG